jgi:hypothetical protein
VITTSSCRVVIVKMSLYICQNIGRSCITAGQRFQHTVTITHVKLCSHTGSICGTKCLASSYIASCCGADIIACVINLILQSVIITQSGMVFRKDIAGCLANVLEVDSRGRGGGDWVVRVAGYSEGDCGAGLLWTS